MGGGVIKLSQGVVVMGGQWGDEGKGRLVDTIAEYCDVVARFHGGNNAGHSLHIGNSSLVLHLIPCGIVRPNKLCLIGNGVVLDPQIFFEEILKLEQNGIKVSNQNLKVSYDAHIIFPFHKSLDSQREASAHGLGTTKRGIGPCYEDKIARVGIRAKDLVCKNILEKKLSFFAETKNINLNELLVEFLHYGEKLKPFLADIGEILQQSFDSNKRVLFEGAQGALLDVDHGTYPFVTSSNCVAAQASIGSGIGPNYLQDIFMVSKAYCTRVGDGPFPTEGTSAEQEVIRARGFEYGATTKRPRRCGWLDLPALRYAARINGATGILLTKIDILCDMGPIKVCVGYKDCLGNTIYNFAEVLKLIQQNEKVYPHYAEFNNLPAMPNSVKQITDLSKEAQELILLIEKEVKVPVKMLSFGKERGKEIWFN